MIEFVGILIAASAFFVGFNSFMAHQGLSQINETRRAVEAAAFAASSRLRQEYAYRHKHHTWSGRDDSDGLHEIVVGRNSELSRAIQEIGHLDLEPRSLTFMNLNLLPALVVVVAGFGILGTTVFAPAPRFDPHVFLLDLTLVLVAAVPFLEQQFLRRRTKRILERLMATPPSKREASSPIGQLCFLTRSVADVASPMKVDLLSSEYRQVDLLANAVARLTPPIPNEFQEAWSAVSQRIAEGRHMEPGEARTIGEADDFEVWEQEGALLGHVAFQEDPNRPLARDYLCDYLKMVDEEGNRAFTTEPWMAMTFPLLVLTWDKRPDLLSANRSANAR